MTQTPVAIVSGGTRGIGLAIVERFLREGWWVMTCAVNDPTAAFMHDKLRRDYPGARLEYREADMGHFEQVDAFVKETVDLLGPPRAVVNNAAFVRFLPTHEATQEDLDRTWRVNVLGYWRLAQQTYQHMARHDGGAIVNIGSTHPIQTAVHSFPYNMSKGAVLAMTKAMAVDFAVSNVRVNTVLPGFVYTDQAERWLGNFDDPQAKLETVRRAHPLRRLPQVQEVASAVYYLASDASSGITGVDLLVDAGRQAMKPADI